jgi:raffinose/stachyose/melibiose transport system permease protein
MTTPAPAAPAPTARPAQPPARRRLRPILIGGAAMLAFLVVFVLPFLFILLQAVKDRRAANRLDFTWPETWHFRENLIDVIQTRDYMVLLAFFNSTLITVAAVTLLVIFAAMVGYVLSRRKTKVNGVVMVLVLAGLMIPPAIVPTIWVMQGLGLFKTLHGFILVQVAYGLPFSILLYRAFIANIPRELDEAAIIDGAKPWQVFFRVILPLLKPVTVTNIVVQSIAIFNDFTNALYYLPGRENVTVQLTLFNFQSQFSSQYNLLFMNILLITIPPLIVFIFFNRQIVAGMTAGAVKG